MPSPLPVPDNLFRKEVFAQFQHRLEGDLLCTGAAGPRWPAALVALACCALLAFVALARYTRTADISGTLVPRDGLLRVTSPQAGVVVERRVGEGAAVPANAPLFILTAERNGATVGAAGQRIAESMQARQASLLAELRQLDAEAAQRKALQEREQRHRDDERRHVADEMALQSQRVQLADAQVSRYVSLQQRGYVADMQLQQVQADLLDQRQRLAELARTALSLRQASEDALRQQRELHWQSDHAAAALRRELALLDEGTVDAESRRLWQVRAPLGGVVSALQVEAGQTVAAGQSLAALMPGQAPLEAELLAPSHAVGFLRAGQPVWLRYRAYPYQKFGLQRGQVREVAVAALPSDGQNEPLYRVRVSLAAQTVSTYGQPRPLRPGTVVDASVQLDRRRLVEWLLEPLLGLRGRA